jgi:hypothetical protein
MIPGSNNGTFGAGMSRGAVFPADPGYFYQGFPLPNMIQHPTGVVDRPYSGNAFGRAFGRRFGMVYELTPGGITTSQGWGFKNKAFGRRSRRRSRRRSSSRLLEKHRCKGIKENGKRCKHKTNGQFCKHHLKQARRSRRRS